MASAPERRRPDPAQIGVVVLASATDVGVAKRLVAQLERAGARVVAGPDDADLAVFVASPAAADDDEVREWTERFLTRHETDDVLIAVIDGTPPGQPARSGESALPSWLDRVMSVEPLWVDARTPTAESAAFERIVAAVQLSDRGRPVPHEAPPPSGSTDSTVPSIDQVTAAEATVQEVHPTASSPIVDAAAPQAAAEPHGHDETPPTEATALGTRRWFVGGLGVLIAALLVVIVALMISTSENFSPSGPPEDTGGGESTLGTRPPVPSVEPPDTIPPGPVEEGDRLSTTLVVGVVLSAAAVVLIAATLARRAGASTGRATPAAATAVSSQAPPGIPLAFVSHDHADGDLVDDLAARLGPDVDVWLARSRIDPGDSWVFEISDALESSTAVIVVLTPGALESNWVRREISAAMLMHTRSGKPLLLPLKARPCSLPVLLETYQVVDATTLGLDGAVGQLRSGILAVSGRPHQ